MKIKIGDLACDTVDVKPQAIDWQEARGEDGEGWEAWEAGACEKCNELVVLGTGGGEERHRDIDPESECEGHVCLFEGPAMNYWYPVDWSRYIADHDDAARRIANLPVCLVMVDGERGLALTGGGMDLSWEICEAFILLGYLPPRHFSGDLPPMRAHSPARAKRMRLVLGAARRTVQVMRTWLDGDVRRIKQCAEQIDEPMPPGKGRAA